MPKAAWRVQPDGSALLPYGDFAPLAIACARLPPAGYPARTVVRESLLDSALHRYWQVVVAHLPGGYVGRSLGVMLEMLATLSDQLGDAASVITDANGNGGRHPRWCVNTPPRARPHVHVMTAQQRSLSPPQQRSGPCRRVRSNARPDGVKMC